MKTSTYIALVLFFVSGLGAAAILLLKDIGRDDLPTSTQAGQPVNINWGEGVQIKWDTNTAKDTPGKDLKLARN